MEPPTPRTMAWLLLLCLAAAAMGGAVAQPGFGFVTIDCGLPGETGFLGNNSKLYFSTDAGFIDSGVNYNISFDNIDPSARSSWDTVRSFPNGTRNCYTIGLPESGLKYLIRGNFWYGNYDRLNRLPIFDLYIGVNFWSTVNISSIGTDSAFAPEAIVVVPENFVQVCLVNTGFGTPFINGLQLRPLKYKMYPEANETQALLQVARYNFGPSDTDIFFRYPDDPYDRIWGTYPDPRDDYDEIKTDKEVESYREPYEPPMAVMKTAITPRNASENILFWLSPSGSPLNDTSLSYIAIMHFAELNILPSDAFRNSKISVNGEYFRGVYPSYLNTRSFVHYTTNSTYRVTIEAQASSTLPPIINAAELFSVFSTTNLGTDAQDASTMMLIKKKYQVHKNWMGDPCFPDSLAWEGLNCSYAASKRPIIRSVNLSFSGLSGAISPSFANISNLQYLDLSNNNLIGSVPDELSQLPSLTLIDLSNNKLNGSIPAGLHKRIQDGSLVLRYGNNPNLCSSSSCQQPAQGRSKRVIIIVAIVIGVMVTVLSVGVLLFCLQRRKRQGSITTSNNGGYKDSSLQLESRQFTYKELERITKNFQHVLGQGGFGYVYHGILENGTEVAVKLRSDSSDQGVREFLVEAQVLARIHHKNLVSLIGYCKEGEHMALVYEYMPEGNLQEHIAGKDRNGGCLTWRQRLRIALESSQGLEYLHRSCNPPLVHRDIKSTNVLLNAALEAKIADFGLSKAFSVSDNAYTSTATLIGTPGYVDPEYQATMQPSTNSDVYSFGVVLLELITGKPAIMRDPEPISLIRWAQRRLSRGDIEAVVDASMQGDYDVNSVWKAAETALKCMELDSLQRPTMTEVVVQLQECLELENRIGDETTNELNSESNTFEMDQHSFKRASTMDDGPAAR